MGTDAAKRKPCSFCGQNIPTDMYADAPENHAPNCSVREVMEVRLAREEDERRKRAAEESATVIRCPRCGYHLLAHIKLTEV